MPFVPGPSVILLLRRFRSAATAPMWDGRPSSATTRVPMHRMASARTVVRARRTGRPTRRGATWPCASLPQSTLPYFEPNTHAYTPPGRALRSASDCPTRYVDYGPLTYSSASMPPYPPPPPSPQEPPPPSPSPYKFVACDNTCPYKGPVCSDGGMGAFLIDDIDNEPGVWKFVCDYGTSCDACGARTRVNSLRADVPPYAFNNFCHDTVQGGRAGYGTDTHDCGVMPVQHRAGVPEARLQERRQLADERLGEPLGASLSLRRVPTLYPNRSAPLQLGRRLQTPSVEAPAPPPPPPQPPSGLDRCECACYGASAASDIEWDPMTLNAMATTPSENTVLYSAQAVVGRGATAEVAGTLYVDGANSALARYVAMPSLSSRVAHIATGWLVTGDATETEQLPILAAAPDYYRSMCTWYRDFWDSSYDQDRHPCAESEYRANCLIGEGAHSCATGYDCSEHYCFATAESLPGCNSVHKAVCDQCRSCLETVDTSLPSHRLPWADAWKKMPNASTSPPKWRDRCTSRCVAKAGDRRYQLAYVQVDLRTTAQVTCSCFEAASPKLPSDADATEWLADNAVHTASAHGLDIYVVRANHPRQQFVATADATVNYEQAYHHGIVNDDLNLDVSFLTNADQLTDCVEYCATRAAPSNSFTLRGFSYDNDVSGVCKCYDNDPTHWPTRAAITYTSTTATTYYSASVCAHARPDPDENSFVWNRAAQSWCAGQISEDHAGVVAIDGAVYAPTDATDHSKVCADECVYGCQFAETMITPWSDLAGAIPIDPPPPPSPPSPPPGPPPPLNPWPPGGPATDDTYWRTWHPTSAEYPADDDRDGEYEITCGVSSCGQALPVFKGGIDTTLLLARELEAEGTFHQTLCPWEWCAHTPLALPLLASARRAASPCAAPQRCTRTSSRPRRPTPSARARDSQGCSSLAPRRATGGSPRFPWQRCPEPPPCSPTRRNAASPCRIARRSWPTEASSVGSWRCGTARKPTPPRGALATACSSTRRAQSSSTRCGPASPSTRRP